MNIWDQTEEAKRLSDRFEGVNRAGFARKFKVPGGGAGIYQHIKGIRPISMDAAIAYASGFSCTLEEISPRLAIDARKSAAVLPSKEKNNKKENAPEKTPGHTHNRKLVDRLCRIAEEINDLGLMYLIGKAEEVMKQHPHDDGAGAVKQTKVA